MRFVCLVISAITSRQPFSASGMYRNQSWFAFMIPIRRFGLARTANFRKTILIHTCRQPRRGPQTRAREPPAVGCTASALLGRRAATRTISSGSGTGGQEGCASAGSPVSRPGTCAEIAPERRCGSVQWQPVSQHRLMFTLR